MLLSHQIPQLEHAAPSYTGCQKIKLALLIPQNVIPNLRRQQKSLAINLKKSSSAGLIPKNSILLSKLVSESGLRASNSNILKIPSSILLSNSNNYPKIQSETKIRKKLNFRTLCKGAVGLSKDQRYYEN